MDTVEAVLCGEQPCDYQPCNEQDQVEQDQVEQPCERATSPEDEQLEAIYDRMLAGDDAARNELILAAMPLAERVAKLTSTTRRNWTEDEIQEAYFELTKIAGWLRTKEKLKAPLPAVLRVMIRRHLQGDGCNSNPISVPRTTAARRLKDGKEVPRFKQVSVTNASQVDGYRRGRYETEATIEDIKCPASKKSELDKMVDAEEYELKWQAIGNACQTADKRKFIECKLDGLDHKAIAEKLGIAVGEVSHLATGIYKRARENFAATEATTADPAIGERFVASQCFHKGSSPAERVALWKSRTGLGRSAFYDRLREARSDGTFALSV